MPMREPVYKFYRVFYVECPEVEDLDLNEGDDDEIGVYAGEDASEAIRVMLRDHNIKNLNQAAIDSTYRARELSREDAADLDQGMREYLIGMTDTIGGP